MRAAHLAPDVVGVAVPAIGACLTRPGASANGLRDGSTRAWVALGHAFARCKGVGPFGGAQSGIQVGASNADAPVEGRHAVLGKRIVGTGIEGNSASRAQVDD